MKCRRLPDDPADGRGEDATASGDARKRLWAAAAAGYRMVSWAREVVVVVGILVPGGKGVRGWSIQVRSRGSLSAPATMTRAGAPVTPG